MAALGMARCGVAVVALPGLARQGPLGKARPGSHGLAG
jgi:hypothetical protein